MNVIGKDSSSHENWVKYVATEMLSKNSVENNREFRKIELFEIGRTEEDWAMLENCDHAKALIAHIINHNTFVYVDEINTVTPSHVWIVLRREQSVFVLFYTFFIYVDLIHILFVSKFSSSGKIVNRLDESRVVLTGCGF